MPPVSEVLMSYYGLIMVVTIIRHEIPLMQPIYFPDVFIMFYVLSHQIFQHPSTDIFETLMSHGVALTAVEFGVAIRLPLKCP